jgi:hypothetical protein
MKVRIHLSQGSVATLTSDMATDHLRRCPARVPIRFTWNGDELRMAAGLVTWTDTTTSGYKVCHSVGADLRVGRTANRRRARAHQPTSGSATTSDSAASASAYPAGGETLTAGYHQGYAAIGSGSGSGSMISDERWRARTVHMPRLDRGIAQSPAYGSGDPITNYRYHCPEPSPAGH